MDLVDTDVPNGKVEDENDDGGGNHGPNDEATIAKWKAMMKLRTSEGRSKSSLKSKSKPKFKKKKKQLPRGSRSKTGRESGIGTGGDKTDSSQWNIGDYFQPRNKGNSPGNF